MRLFGGGACGATVWRRGTGRRDTRRCGIRRRGYEGRVREGRRCEVAGAGFCLGGAGLPGACSCPGPVFDWRPVFRQTGAPKVWPHAPQRGSLCADARNRPMAHRGRHWVRSVRDWCAAVWRRGTRRRSMRRRGYEERRREAVERWVFAWGRFSPGGGVGGAAQGTSRGGGEQRARKMFL